MMNIFISLPLEDTTKISKSKSNKGIQGIVWVRLFQDLAMFCENPPLRLNLRHIFYVSFRLESRNPGDDGLFLVDA